MTTETRTKLRSYRKSKTAHYSNLQQDNVYIIEKILKVEAKEETKYLVQWFGFPESEATWEPEKAVPGFLKEFYNNPNNVGKNIPKTLSNFSHEVSQLTD